MDVKDFKSGRSEQQYQYRSFLPTTIDTEWTVSDPQTLTLLEDASRLLGELNTYSRIVPGVDFFIHMHLLKEATTSSRIEGTQTNMEEALLDANDIDPERRDDWVEVQNYTAAIGFAIERLQTMPLSNRLLRDTHAVLMRGVRGRNKQPGEFRRSQNWIGTSLKNATFVPPHQDHVPELMSDLEKFMHDDDIHVPHLIRIAIIHYQFETIHPFLDGNGRLGRLMIALYMVSFGLLAKPALYLSDFFERHKSEYYDALMSVRNTSKLLPWLQFFLTGVHETSASSIQVFRDITTLKERIEREKLPTFHPRRQAHAQALMQNLYQRPMITIKEATTSLDVQTNTAAALITDFVRLGILRELTGQKRNRQFMFDEYVRLFMRGSEESE